MLSRRIAIISLVLLISGVALLGYFLHQGRKNLFSDPYKVIPTDACIVIETTDLQDLINSVTAGKGLFSELQKIEEFDGFFRRLNFFASLIGKPGFKKYQQGGKALIAFLPSADGKLTPMLSMTYPAEIALRQMKESLVSAGIRSFIEKKMAGKRFFTLPFNDAGKNDTVFLEVSPGLLVCSRSENIVRKALAQKNVESDIRNSPGFSRVLLASGSNKDKLFIVFGNLSGVFKKVFNVPACTVADKISRLAACAGGDLFINDDGIAVSGYTESTDSTQILYPYKSVGPGEFDTYKVLPSETALFESVIANRKNTSAEIQKNTGNNIFNLALRLRPYISEEITRAYIDINNSPAGQNSIIVYKLSNRVQCESIFEEELKEKLSTSYFQPDEQTRIPIYSTGPAGLVSALSPGFAQGFTDSYFTFYDNFMVAGTSNVTLSRFLYDNILNKTLANDVQYREFEKMLQSRAGYLFYCVPSHVIDYLSPCVSQNIIEGLRKNRGSLGKIQSAGVQLASINGMLYSNLSLKYREETVEESPTEWETLLDTTAAIKPFFFTNHNTGAREIFIQDLNNNAYLINSAGRVLWKVPIKERINGSVYMIDYYRNGKYQILFSGKNNLHLLDRNGNYVDRYPVRLRSPATNSLAVFDYDYSRNYRLVIAGEDRQIYSYEKNGSVVKGWKPFRTAGNVVSEAVFCRVSGKDYIIVADEYSLYILDRSGNIRVNIKDAVTKAKNSSIRLVPGTESYLICSSPDGTIQNIYFDGRVTKFSLGSFSVDHSFDFFDVDGDRFGEYIFIDKGILYLYDHNRKEMFRKDFKTGDLGGPINFVFSSDDRKIGVFDIDKDLIYLIDSKGNIMNGFPLRGASMFSIGKLSAKDGWNLIVGGTDRFLYNYKLNTTVQ